MTVAPALIGTSLQRSEWSKDPPLLTSRTQSSIFLTKSSVSDDETTQARIPHKPNSSSRALPYLTFTIGLLLGGVAAGIALGISLTPLKTTTTTTTTTTSISTSTSTSTTSTGTTSTTSETTTTATTTATSVTTTTTTVITPTVNAVWSFDGNTLDTYNIYNAVAYNGPSYVTGYTGQSSTALAFNQSAFQYVLMSSSFVDLTFKSFTVEMWVYPTILALGDFGLFGQCDTTSPDLCLILMIRNYHLLLAFHSDDTGGLTDICINQWYHVAFVYDYPSSTQSVYLNGILEVIRASNAYQGTVGDIYIGAINNGGPFYFNGYIDQVSLLTRTKNAAEILMDATLVCYFSFDSSLYTDLGPLSLSATGVGVSLANNAGRLNSAISFASTSTYFVVGGLTRLGTVGQAYSISLWIQPTSLNGGTIPHVSRCNAACGSNWCLPFIGLTSSGQIAIESWSGRSPALMTLTGPTLSINVWTHVVHTYSSTNGIRLYINGTLYSQSPTFIYRASGSSNYLFLGSFPVPICVGSSVISQGQYYGFLDEFYIFARDLTPAEVYLLANP